MIMLPAWAACTDLSPYEEELEGIDSRIKLLNQKCEDVNRKVASLKELVEMVEAREAVTGVSEVSDDDGKIVGYVVTFRNNTTLIFNVPEDPGDGPAVEVPDISVKYDGTGYWWTIGGEFILDDGNKVPVAGPSGISPKLRIEGGEWQVSVDGGGTWLPVTVDEGPGQEFAGVVSVVKGTSDVTFVLADGSVLKIPLSDVATLSLTYSRNVVPGVSATVSYRFSSSTGVANVSVFGNRYIGSVSVNHRPMYGDGFIYVNISENHDVSLQKLFVYLDYGTGTLTKVLSFNEEGVFEIDAVAPVPAFGGDFEVNITEDGYDYVYAEVTSGGSWLTGSGRTYYVAENTDYHARTGTIMFQARNKYGTPLFNKTLSVVQYGKGDFPCYDEYVGNWKMDAKDFIAGAEVSRDIKVKRDPEDASGYLIEGLTPSSGLCPPVRATYNQITGSMELKVPQKGLGGSDVGLYYVSSSSGVPVISETEYTFVFHSGSSLNVMSSDMSAEDSFMYAEASGGNASLAPVDNVLYYDVSFTRQGVPGYYTDGQVVMLNNASAGLVPLNLVILGDGYQKKDLRHGGKFESRAWTAMGNFFALEPFKSFKDRFNVYMVPYESVDEGPDVTASGTVSDTYFSSVCAGGGNTLVTCDYDAVLDAVRAIGLTEENNDLYRTVAILLVNTTEQSGSCWYIKGGRTDEQLVGDGYKSFAVAMLASDTMGAGGLVRHEAAGHGFGRLADEYNWGAAADEAKKASLKSQQEDYGFYHNVTADTGDGSPWARFIGLEGYGQVGYYEGAWGCSTGLYRPTSSSIMLNNQGTFNAPSREIIYRRIILQTEGPGSYSFEDFLEYDRRNL